MAEDAHGADRGSGSLVMEAGGAGGAGDAMQKRLGASSRSLPPDGFQMPPYTENDDIQAGVSCYLCAPEASKWFQWGGLMEHIRQKHSIQRTWMKGCYLYVVGMVDIREQERTRRWSPRITHHNVSMCLTVMM